MLFADGMFENYGLKMLLGLMLIAVGIRKLFR